MKRIIIIGIPLVFFITACQNKPENQFSSSGGSKPIPTYTVTVSKAGSQAGNGVIVSTPTGIRCGTQCNATYAEGTSVAFSVQQGTSSFAGWSGDCSGMGGCQLQLSDNKNVVAIFGTTIRHTLNVERAGSGLGTVRAGSEINCGTDCEEEFWEGSVVNLEALADTQSVFTGWSGACSGTGACAVAVDAPKTVVAHFSKKRTLTVVSGPGGHVSSTPTGINCGSDCSQDFPESQTVTLTASPNPGYRFTGWSGACGGAADCTVNMDIDKSVTAFFAVDYSGNWAGLTSQVLPMSFVVANSRISETMFMVSIAGCGTLTQTTSYGSPVPIATDGSFNTGGSFDYFKGKFTAPTAASGQTKLDLSSFCGVRATIDWSAQKNTAGAAARVRTGTPIRQESWTDSLGNRHTVELYEANDK